MLRFAKPLRLDASTIDTRSNKPIQRVQLHLGDQVQTRIRTYPRCTATVVSSVNFSSHSVTLLYYAASVHPVYQRFYDLALIIDLDVELSIFVGMILVARCRSTYAPCDNIFGFCRYHC